MVIILLLLFTPPLVPFTRRLRSELCQVPKLLQIKPIWDAGAPRTVQGHTRRLVYPPHAVDLDLLRPEHQTSSPVKALPLRVPPVVICRSVVGESNGDAAIVYSAAMFVVRSDSDVISTTTKARPPVLITADALMPFRVLNVHLCGSTSITAIQREYPCPVTAAVLAARTEGVPTHLIKTTRQPVCLPTQTTLGLLAPLHIRQKRGRDRT